MSGGALKVGIVGLDGHGPVFAEVLNGPSPPVEGMRAVKAMPVPSALISEESLKENVERTRALGVEIVSSPTDLADGVDGILILHDDGARHLALARQFADKGRPLFVDKPFEVTGAAARELVRLCRQEGCPCFSASSLRFSKELRSCLAEESAGAVLSAVTFSPWHVRPTMPGWIYYAVHAVEPLFQIMGPGCLDVWSVESPSGPVAVARWGDGRLGVARAVRGGGHDYGFTVWRERRTYTCVVDAGAIYVELLRQIKGFIETGTPPVQPEESAEVVTFLEAANASMAAGGAPVSPGG